MSVKDIYDFEGVVESAAQSVLQELGLTAATTLDLPQFQKDRPRVEIKFVLGRGNNRFVYIDPTTGVNAAVDPSVAAGKTGKDLYTMRRESAWDFELYLYAISEFDIVKHIEYRTQVRAVAAIFWTLMNMVKLTRHSIELNEDQGNSEPTVAPDKSYIKTQLRFSGKISVQADAWPALVTT
jgi:hypothetical protein